MLLHMPTPASHEGQQGRVRPAEFDPRPLEEEMMNALVVEDSPQIAERLVELVSVPHRVEVVATAATEDEAFRLATSTPSVSPSWTCSSPRARDSA